jgi:trimeric autotransporter adhesin
MKKLSVVLCVSAALVLLLAGPSGTSGALASPLSKQAANASIPSAAVGDEKWEDTFAIPGLGCADNPNHPLGCPDDFTLGPAGRVSAFAVDTSGGNLYAGGEFRVAGGTPAKNVAKWDGTRWLALGDGLSWPVNALAVDGNGIVYAAGGGWVGAQEVNQVARWNGSTWTTVGNMTAGGTTRAIYALGVDGNNYLYAGGRFEQVNSVTVNGIARWNGTSWSALSTGVSGGAIRALRVDSAGRLFAGGIFSSAGGVETHTIAYWNGLTWQTVGDIYGPARGTLYAMVMDGTGNLYVAGNASDAFGIYAGVSKWNGTTWSDVGSANDYIYSLTFDGSGKLYAGGRFTTIGSVSAKGVARLDGTTWSALGSGVGQFNSVFGGQVNVLASVGGNLFAGGTFTKAGNVVAYVVALWTGSAWSGVGAGGSGGFDSEVYAMALDGSSGLYAGGKFRYAGGTSLEPGNVAANGIAHWNGSGWSALGTGISQCQDLGSGCSPEVRAIATSGNNVYIGGNFKNAGGVSVSHIAKWDGQNWSSLGTGTDQPVKALAVDGNGNVYAGGNFTNAGGVSVYGLARWNGTAWEKLPSSNAFCQTHLCGVSALTFDRSGNLYLGGVFDIGGAWKQIAKWDGIAFVGAGGAPVGDVVALAVGPDGRLYAGGDGAHGLTAGVACWDWISWSWSMVGPARGPIYALAFDSSGSLYAGGAQYSVGDFGMARWGGSSWSPLGSDVHGTVYTLAADSSKLYVGGTFDVAGPKLSGNIARYSPSGIPPSLLINYTTGKPGSSFFVSGSGFPAGDTATVTVNGHVLSSALTVDGAGGLTFHLDTSLAGAGQYFATVSVNPSASVAFTLDSNAPLRSQEGSGPTFNVPGGIAFTRFVYLPLVRR